MAITKEENLESVSAVCSSGRDFSVSSPSVIVIGGGFAGIAAARALQDASFKVMLLESRDRIGGRVYTDYSFGFPVDMGASWLHGVCEENPLAPVIGRLGLSLYRTSGDNSVLYDHDLESYALFDMDGIQVPSELVTKVGEAFEEIIEETKKVRDEVSEDMSVEQAFSIVLERRPELRQHGLSQKVLQWYLCRMEGWFAADADIISLKTWDQEELLEGGHGLMVQGYYPVLQDLSEGLDIHLNHRVTKVFMVVRVDDESDHEFDSALYLLNEKLERVKVSPSCLTTVLDRIASSFTTFKCLKKKAKISQNSNFCAGVPDEKQLIESGFLYKLAKEAQTICEVVRNNAGLDFLNLEGKPKSGEQILFWCDVSADPASCTVQLEMELVGIIGSFHWAEALGFSSENPLKINLHFSKEFWLKDKISPEVFRASCSCQNQKTIGAYGDRKGKEEDGMGNLYGPEVLVPELTMLFLANGDNVAKLPAKDSVNQFVQLLIFVGMRLSLLPSWCVICKKELPFFPSRLCTCNGLSCLYRFQELGLGKTVLQEVQNSSELVDFEISLVLAASKSTADVFEPLQAFFPENEGMCGKPQICRDTSGTKEHGDSGNLRREYILQSELGSSINNEAKKKVLTRNEKLKLLQNIIKTFPPVAEMKKCADECKLRLKLEESWLQILGKDSHDGDQQLLKKAFVERISFPYDILRFILYTNRVKLHLLEGDAILPIPDSLYQLAVLHDSVEEGDIFHNCHDPESQSFFAFHGSSVENLYTVLRNNVRYLGRTTNMPSINLSSQLSAAVGYSTKADIDWENGALANGFFLAAICEVISRPERFVDNTKMMVSPEDVDVALRYLIIFKDPDGHNNTHIVDGHTLSGKIDLHIHYKHVRGDYKRNELSQCLIYKQHRKSVFDRRVVNTNYGSYNEAVSVSTATNPGAFVHDLERNSNLKTNSSMKTIMKEYHNLAKVLEHGQTNTTGLAGVVLKLPDENDICRWHVSLSQNLFKDHPIYKDLVEYARQKNVSQACILLEITFPDDYPFAPPFVRIIRPRFSRYTGHITVGGSICMELLTKSGWSPACSIESLLVQVQNAIIEGGGRLDRNALVSDNEYGETEAHEAFDRVALDHGWI